MNILIVNPFGIGDVLFSTPMVSNLKLAYPQGHISYICNARAKDVLQGNPALDEIFVFEKDEYRILWQKSKLQSISNFFNFLNVIRKAKFDLVIDLSLGHQYSFFFWLIGIKRRIGYNYKKRGRFLTQKIDISGYETKPVADYYLDLLKFLDIKPKRLDLSMSVDKEDIEWANKFCENNKLGPGDSIIGIVPAGGASWGKDFAYRHWPWENYAKLADMLIKEFQVKVIIFGGPSEVKICRQVQGKMRSQVADACGKTTLKQFAALLRKCNVTVCNDGGPLHVVVSQGVSTVSIFGPVDEKVYGPYPPVSKHTVVTKDIDCRPCYKKFRVASCKRDRECIKSISAEQILDIIRNKLNKR